MTSLVVRVRNLMEYSIQVIDGTCYQQSDDTDKQVDRFRSDHNNAAPIKIIADD